LRALRDGIAVGVDNFELGANVFGGRASGGCLFDLIVVILCSQRKKKPQSLHPLFISISNLILCLSQDSKPYELVKKIVISMCASRKEPELWDSSGGNTVGLGLYGAARAQRRSLWKAGFLPPERGVAMLRFMDARCLDYRCRNCVAADSARRAEPDGVSGQYFDGQGKLAEAGAPERGADPAAKRMRRCRPARILERANKAMAQRSVEAANTIMMKGVLQTEDSSAFVALRFTRKHADKSLMKMNSHRIWRCGSVRRGRNGLA